MTDAQCTTNADGTGKKTPTDRIRRQVKHLMERIESCARFAARASEAGDTREHAKMREEKAAAERMLARRAAEYDLDGSTPPQRAPRELRNPGAWTGEKFTAEIGRTSVKDIAAMIRADIRMARTVGRKSWSATDAVAIPDPIGDAPSEIKIRTRTRHHTGIDVVLEGIPQDWGFTEGEDRAGHPCEVPTPALVDLLSALKDIHNAYNYDNSEAQTDYFERHYGGGVYVASESGGHISYPTGPYAYRRR